VKKTLLLGLSAFVGLVVVILLYLPYITDLRMVRDRVAATASDALQHPVTIGRLGLRAIPNPGLQLADLRITEREGTPLVKVETVIFELKLGPLLGRKVDIARIIIGHPQFTLTRNPDGSLNLPIPPPPATPPPATPASKGALPTLTYALDEARVEDGEVTIRDRQQQSGPLLLHFQKLNVTLNDIFVHGKTPDDFKRSLNGSARLEVRGGSIGKFETLAQIISLLNVKQQFSGKAPDFSHEGITIDSLAGTFRFKDGLMTIDDMKLKSAILDAAVKGTFNLPDRHMNMVVSAAGMDFDVQGSADNPHVSSQAAKAVGKEAGKLLEKGLGLFK